MFVINRRNKADDLDSLDEFRLTLVAAGGHIPTPAEAAAEIIRNHPQPPNTRFDLGPQYFPYVRQPLSISAQGGSGTDFSFNLAGRSGNLVVGLGMNAGPTPLGPNTGATLSLGRAF